MDLVVQLQKSHLFHFMKEKDLRNIIEASGSHAEYKTGESLFFEGEDGNYFFIIISGKVRISRMSEEGKVTVLKVMQSGDSFAEVILFGENKYPATAKALKNTSVLRIEKKSFKKLLRNSEISEAFIFNLIKKLKFLVTKVELFSNAEVSDRFYHFIEAYYGRSEVINLSESKKEIAEEIGTVPETFSRMINKLKKNGIILSWSKNQLILKKGFWQSLHKSKVI